MPERRSTQDRPVGQVELSGWGRTRPARCDVLPAHAEEREALRAAVRGVGPRGLVVRGAGRSYGDAAQNSGGTVIRLSGGAVHIDPAARCARSCGDVSLREVLRTARPHMLSLPVLPGTQHVTVGGAIAADVHGKNHLSAGSLGRHLTELVLLDGTGTVRTLRPTGPGAEQFWATVGGMGLTGIVLEATLRLVPVASDRLRVRSSRAAGLSEVLVGLEDAARRAPYAVAWLDLLPRSTNWGRGIISRGRYATAGELPARPPARHLPHHALPVPPLPVRIVTGTTARAFNALWWGKPLPAAATLQPVPQFFFPLDALRDWNRLYGPQGLVQYQFVVPTHQQDTLRQVCQLLSACTPLLAVLKRFGDVAPGPLSFPRPGWCVAVDLPAGHPAVPAALDRADELVAAAGGAVYLAKDGRLRPDLLSVMYPRLPQWRSTQAQLDPHGRLQSDLARRLGLARHA